MSAGFAPAHLEAWTPCYGQASQLCLAAGSTKGQQDAHHSQRPLSFLGSPQIVRCGLALVVASFIFSLLTFKEEAIWPHGFCCVAVGMARVQHLFLEAHSSLTEEHGKAWLWCQVPPAHHERAEGILEIKGDVLGVGLDTNLTNFSLSTPVFSYLLLLDSTSVYRKSDKTSLSFKNCVTEANSFVSQLKSRMHVLTQKWE